MSTNPSALIQQKIDAVDRHWRWVKFLEYFFGAGAGFVLAWIAVELLAWRGVLTETWLFLTFVGLYGIAALLAFMGIAVAVTAREPRRAWLADRLERGCPGLLDRLNTLVYIERLRRPFPYAMRRQIESQAAQVFEQEPVASRISSARAWQRFGIFALLLTCAILFDSRVHPFARLLNPPSAQSAAAKNDAPFELVPGDVNETTKTQKPWGEVRIVTPGHDVKLTKVDVLPLQIEMAASGQLQNPAWITSINGGPEQRHELAPPSEPQYAVYQPMIYLDELKVEEWDVVSYYAKVETPAPAEYASQIYFIEIRPFREDILKHAGAAGGGNHGRELLDEISDLIGRQTTVVQQTHLYQQTEYPSDDMRKQDKKKLVDAEGGLSDASNHLYGQIVAENENAPIGEILDHLAGAQQQMDKAVDNLGEDVIPLAKQNEQSALAELIATRKSFYKTLSEHPGAFGPNGDGTAPDQMNDPVATTKDSLKSLSQVTEMRDRDQSALNQLKELAQQQQNLANAASAANDAGTNSGNGAAMAKTESDLKSGVEKLMQDNPDLFRDVDSEKASLQSDMQQAVDSLNSGDNDNGSHYLTHAAGDMSDLQKAVQRNHQLQQTAEAYKLKKIIDQNIQQLGQEKNKGGSLSPQEIKDLADAATRSTGTLKDITDQPGGGGFGPGLKQSLSPENQTALQQALQKLGQASPGAQSQGAAGDAQGKLSQVSQAFEKSQPDMSKMGASAGQGGQGSGPATGTALDEAMQELQGMILAQQEKQPPSPDVQNKEQDEILGDLEDALSKDKSPQAESLLAQVEDMKKNKKEKPFPADQLKKLLDQIQLASAEANDPDKNKPDKSEITVIDSSKFPESYRDRIRAYYEQLSNRSQ
ncbi:MAG TPA: hypothetical protein VHY09_04140 [Candidatus Methylacidiphilales bacterium]|jgi:hypothetical protein|nr:hypothetical protein [Candidatus Methylacidiphilales bacterium]